MDRLSIDYVVSQVQVPETVARALLDGVSQDKLEDLLVEAYGLVAGSPQVSITRMNTVGGLRAMGYEVNGGRKGRGQPYQIVGFKEKTYPPSADKWTGQARARLEWVHSLPRITLESESIVRQALSNRTDRVHENSWLYIWCYELAKDQGFLYERDGQYCIVMQRFENYPRFRVFNLNMRPTMLLGVARAVAEASCRSVQILNVLDGTQAEYRKTNPGGSWGKRLEAVYDAYDIASDPRKYFGKRGLEMIKSQDREMSYVVPETLINCYPAAMIGYQEQIIAEWRRINEPKQRQLAITRDFVAVKTQSDRKIELVGMRNMIRGLTSVTPANPRSEPACMHILDRSDSVPDMANQIVEKSLNYRDQLGGRPGTADWNLFKTCEFLTFGGVRWLNAGGVDGGGAGLPAHKAKFTDHQVTSYAYYTMYPTGAPT